MGNFLTLSRWTNCFKSHTAIILVFIILLAVFLRGYQSIERFEFSHDGDLYSWIVKDMVVNKHFRLVGQQTSTEGIFIGPYFYYLLIPFFLLTSMDPVGVIFFALLIGIVTVLSFYFVFQRLFGKTTGLVAAFSQAVLLLRVSDDRWVVPTITTNLWGVWYLYAVLMLARGNFAVLPLLGILIGLIWHINLSLALVLLTTIPALIFARKLPPWSKVVKGILGFAVSSIPLALFELRHNFQQARSFWQAFVVDQGGGRGWDKFMHVLQQVVGNTVSLFFYPAHQIFISGILFFIVVCLSGIFFVRKGGIDRKTLTTLYIWIFSVIIFFTFSSKIISEYYFAIISTAVLIFFIMGLALIYKSSTVGKSIVAVFSAFLLVRSIVFILDTEHSGYSHKGYLERKAVVDFIARDAQIKSFPCVAVSYIASPGEDFGFRYLFYLKNLHVNQSRSGSPDYTIVSPVDLVSDQEVKSFGALGVILPKGDYNLREIAQSCAGGNSNLTDPLFGYTQ